MLKSNFFRAKNFNDFYEWRAEKNSGKAAARTNYTEKSFAHNEKFSPRNEKFFYLKGKTTAILGQKEERTHHLRALSSSLYKFTTFFGEKQILLTYRNTPWTVKKTRFAPDGRSHVLSYEVPWLVASLASCRIWQGPRSLSSSSEELQNPAQQESKTKKG